MRSPGFLVYLSLFCLATAVAHATPSSGGLPRRPFLGVTVQPSPNHHVWIEKIIPDSSAARSDLQVGDILLSIDGTPVGSVDAFLAGVKAFKSGDRFTSRIQRGGTEKNVELVLGEWPREHPDDIDVLYDAVETPGASVRSILTMPMGNLRKLPSILFVQGWDCGSVDLLLPGQRELIYRLTRAGFVVMRSEKSGVGDSTGTPCRDVDFHDEVALFTSALRKLKSYDFVDTGKVFIFGHSAGGWVAPLVAMTEPVKGIAVYGTVVRPFGEYLVENWRRTRWRRTQSDLAQVEDEQRRMAELLHYLLVEKRSVREATKQHPEVAAIAKRRFPTDDEHFDDLRTLEHVRQLHDESIARAWASLDVPVLALIGEYDVRTLPMDHEYIAAIVNAHHPGMGTWRLLPRLDHGFAEHDSLKDAAAHEFVGPIGDQVVQETVSWLRTNSG